MFGEIGLGTKKGARGFWASVRSKSLGIVLVPWSGTTNARFCSTQLPRRTQCNSLKTRGEFRGYPSQNRAVLFAACGARP